MKQQEILFLLGSACIVVFVWIAFTIIHNSLTSTISESVTQTIIPINPTFDTKVIDAMTKRSSVAPLYVIQPSITIAPTPFVQQPISSQSAQAATSGGTLR